MSEPADLKEDLDKNLEDFEIQEVLRNGTDLREYALQIDKNIKDAEKSSVADYLKESENIGSLHNQIEECDGILEKMERPLSSFIEDMAVSETLIFGINSVPVTDKEFMVQLAILNQKLNFVKEQDFKETKACHDVKDVLEKLKIKSVAKIRTYILEQIYKFRKPMANYQIPQNAMLKYKFFFEFVLANERNVAQEICNEYIDTLSKVYYSYFKSYASRLDKLKYEEAPTKDDLMGIEDGSKGGFFQKANLKNKSTIFTIGNRGDVLAQQLEAPIIVPHYSYEALFRSLQYALVDNGCREYLFISEFFHVKGSHAQDEQFPSEELSNILLVLQDEVHCFLLKMAAEFSQRVQQLIFLINNYDMVLSILMERTRDNTKEAESFREQLQARSSEYVEEILSPHFGGLIQFVKEGQQILETTNKSDLATLERKSLSLVASFSTGWKQSLEEIHREVLVSFPNLVTGSGLLQMALTNFVQYYHKFVKLLTPNARTQLVNIHVIMVEIKKYKTNY
ncbi:putative Vacuolar protein sorting protein [Operophtera brumata]|uniref:Vacuolar protein sorting-associated protein 52 homolog n=1 Tax=Operophtera brumata TaxID=104452 RepID=A0A0L7LMH5_OPEBR|nr:putative Vacuolar protein sorting protein [Operophtera brumata]